MRRHGIARVASLFVFAFAMTACGNGGGGSGLVAGPADWGIPFLPDSTSFSMRVHLRNLDNGGATVTMQGYMPSGLAYPGPVTVTLDGDDERAFSISTALSGATPAGGWLHVTTPSRRVEVGFNVEEPSFPAEESARAWPLGDLLLPPPSTFAGLTLSNATDFINVSNATATPVVLTVTAYREPASDPLLPPIVSTPPPISLAPFETKTFSASGITGVAGFIGNVTFTGATPFFAAEQEALAFDGQPLAVPTTRLWYTSLLFGTETSGPDSFEDFVILARNDSDSSRTVSVNQIRTSDGGVILASPRSIILAPHESRIVTTQQPPFDDLFGDATGAPFLHVWMEYSAPPEVAVSFRQFNPLTNTDTMTVHAHPVGHVFHTLDVFPSPTLLSGTRTITTVINPFGSEISVDVFAVIPQPDGFDSGFDLLTTLTIPARSSIDFSPDGAVYLDRDGGATPLIGLRFNSNSPFSVAGERVTLSAFDIVLTRSPLLVRDFDDAE